MGGASVYPCPQGTYTNRTGLSSLVQCLLCPADFYCNTPREIEACPQYTHSQEGSTTVLECVCEPGYVCTYQKQLHATVTLPVTQAEFELIRQEFINTMAAAAGVDPSNVRIVGLTPVDEGHGRRLLLLHRLGAVLVDVRILGSHRIDPARTRMWRVRTRHRHRVRVFRNASVY